MQTICKHEQRARAASTSSEHEQRARASSTRTRVCKQFKQRPNICEHIFGIPHVNVSFLIILNQERHCSAKRKLCHYSDFSNMQLRYNLPAWVFFFLSLRMIFTLTHVFVIFNLSIDEMQSFRIFGFFPCFRPTYEARLSFRATT